MGGAPATEPGRRSPPRTSGATWRDDRPGGGDVAGSGSTTPRPSSAAAKAAIAWRPAASRCWTPWATPPPGLDDLLVARGYRGTIADVARLESPADGRACRSRGPPRAFLDSLRLRLLTPLPPRRAAADRRAVRIGRRRPGPVQRPARPAHGLEGQGPFLRLPRAPRACLGAAPTGMPTPVDADKHGGRHYYLEPLSRGLPRRPGSTAAPEGPSQPLHDPRRGPALDLQPVPRADADDGLVALASIVSKTVREALDGRF